MKRFFIAIISALLLLSSSEGRAQSHGTYSFHTEDIKTFWQAYDSLHFARTYDDSLCIMQHVYLDHVSKGGMELLKSEHCTDAKLIDEINRYPRFFTHLRRKTDHLSDAFVRIDTAFRKLEDAVPEYNIPDVYFVVGCFRWSTMFEDKNVIASVETVLIDDNTNLSEFGNQKLELLLDERNGFPGSLIASSLLQKSPDFIWNYSPIKIAYLTGGRYFITKLLTGMDPMPWATAYGLAHECEIWQNFKPQMYNSKYMETWFYADPPNNSYPGTLGYFIGERIWQAYFDKQKDKKKAIKTLFRQGKYLDVLQESGYNGNCNQ